MNWNANDMNTYIQQTEYIDTLIVPLIKVDTKTETMKGAASSFEFLMHVTNFIETQFKGRMMLFPPFSYTASMDRQTIGKALSEDLAKLPFKHRFFITADPEWKNIDVDGTVIWLPAIPLESMDAKLRQTIIEDQLRQVVPILTEKWSG